MIPVNASMVYISNFQKQRIVWRCPGFEKTIEIEDCVWINSLPGCHVRIGNDVFKVPIDAEEIDVEPEFLPNIENLDHDLFEFGYDFHIRNHFFDNQTMDLDGRLQKIVNQTREEVKSVDLSTSPLGEAFSFTALLSEILSGTTIMMVIICVIIVICCTSK